MTLPVTHFKYICRLCNQETMQPVLKNKPEATPVPRCCGSRRDMFYIGVHCEAQEYIQGVTK